MVTISDDKTLEKVAAEQVETAPKLDIKNEIAPAPRNIDPGIAQKVVIQAMRNVTIGSMGVIMNQGEVRVVTSLESQMYLNSGAFNIIKIIQPDEDDTEAVGDARILNRAAAGRRRKNEPTTIPTAA